MTQTSQAITLKGSVAMVTEYFGFAVNSILYQRGVYPPEDFRTVKKYGMPLMVTTDQALHEYMATILQQVANWLSRGEIHRLVLLVTDPSTSMEHPEKSERVLERWVFHVEAEKQGDINSTVTHKKSEEDVQREIQAIMRQITSCVTFLPVLKESVAFDLLVYTSKNTELPSSTWELSEPRLIKNGQEVKLKHFSTTFHHVSTSVAFQE